MKALCLLLILLLSGFAQADELWLASGFISKHDKAGCNEQNIGAGLELSFGNGWALAAGQYRNSMDANSRYVAAVWQPWAPLPHVRLGMVVGTVSGYEQPVLPLLLPVVTLAAGPVGLNMLVIPAVGSVRSGAVALQIKLRLSP